ncbi:DNA-binding NarL/FixJ family response regulator [Dyadobacter sp. BE34]|uniref:DNA-binding NarL/FixJ family response regulator n=1 Tax=Dyadobacter fermentans TaxID=94254 RepID=A0ABU1QU26_9BACT|nr:MULTISPECIES: hypothetical protein [Dyadobacter]MDR6804660.1 DNA-binding NarL/FixJ family response regulator [Dyadobacter fermentans]MDR7043581.1 DNA-binding NarL/FixJ family response regulator [Dyadobacter sp. BE242]MDR7197893.1 DNA-binding NarL/FixJ family response regulator [Dyadobacter sp. BE34]MDR7214674.1 DNA-binding NarL/FixJ family response regulator [Dyadobacter sp. BE31]MDR7262209.1 DNA-binding NarL/FixJ family response regulator [Dyadobacter sp. BE32]
MITTVIDTHSTSIRRLTQTLRESVEDIHIFPFESAESMIDAMTHVGISPALAVISINQVVYEQDLAFCKSITTYWPTCKIIVFYQQRKMVRPFLKLGPHGFLKKDADVKEVRECVEWVLSGRRYCNNDFIDWIIGTSPKRLNVR